MDFEVIKDEKVEEARQDTLEKAVAYEELTHTKGWGYIKAYAQEALNAFSLKAMRTGFVDMAEYQLERGKVVGIFMILNDVEQTIQTLKEDRAERTS